MNIQTKDPEAISNGIINIICSSMNGYDCSYLLPDLVDLLFSENINLVILALRALSIASNHSNSCLNKYPNQIKVLLNNEFTRPHMIRTLTDLLTEELYLMIESDIMNLMETADPYIRKLSFTLISKAALKYDIAFNSYSKSVSMCMLDKQYMYLIFQSFSEIIKIRKDYSYELILLLIPAMWDCDYLLFSKICEYLAFCEKHSIIDSFLPMIEARSSDRKFCYAASLLACHLPQNHILRKFISKKLTNHILKLETESDIILYTKALIVTAPRNTKHELIYQFFFQSKSHKIRSLGLILSGMVDKTFKKTVFESIATAIKENDLNFIETVTLLFPIDGISLFELIYSIASVQENWAKEFVAKSLKNMSEDSKKQFLDDIHTITILPTNDIGKQFAIFISENSNSSKDADFLCKSIALNVSDEFNIVFLQSLLYLHDKIHFQGNSEIKNKLQLMTTSVSREVRQLSAELLNIIEQESN
ncbi:hypothetical protein TVAG_497950 [Trichomonas vaginalis G3]|uniref:Clathrin/coatomer adaptor adaptin-like N-terminal domain-containing protein n=1 Tax=Trichomonas vaginalis (strain ATCC PRA-98 / G3) TaxID=412133 RepID=A2FVB4_TRIV3|nr:armadillo (ARM) repeat-containing protein family [Trichomonas vaginalis G3]EAX91154.1 hypothetical protein TVAG_497950 [Trichomonas vaginalis G3]KAI5547102.1 armadillo (ARM) repeat-containing protein family [Trichomonas vaginalis G3]|eukprot:XP_001304084.1 hypothetical protein [Trichomonas vaginalis G3]